MNQKNNLLLKLSEAAATTVPTGRRTRQKSLKAKATNGHRIWSWKYRTMAVKEWQDQIVFLRRVVPGSADKSYGLHVARLAGLPEALVDRAAEVLANLETQEYDPAGRPRRAEGPNRPEVDTDEQLALFAPPEAVVAKILRDTSVEELTPLAALNLLHSLKTRLD